MASNLERFKYLFKQKAKHLKVFQQAHEGLVKVMSLIQSEITQSNVKKAEYDKQIKAAQDAHVVEDQAIEFLKQEHTNTLETAKSLATILKLKTPEELVPKVT